MSDSKCWFLTCKQISQETGKVVSYFHLFKIFSQFVVIHTIRSFSIVNEAEIDVFLEFPCFLHDSMNVDNLISCSSSFSKPCLYICKFSVYVLLKPSLKDFEHNFTGMWNEYNCMVAWIFFGIALLWNLNENWSLPVLWSLLSFPNLLPYWLKHFSSINF